MRNLVQQRSLVVQLVRRDFQQRYVGSAAGWIWGVVHPLVLLLSWTFIFQICLKTKLPPGSVTQNYTMFLFCGMLPWLLFQETVLRSAPSMVEHANLITKTLFPAEVVPVSIFLSSLIHHLIALLLVMVASAIVLKSISPMVLLLPLYMLFIGLFAVGVGWFVSSLHVYLRDTVQDPGRGDDPVVLVHAHHDQRRAASPSPSSLIRLNPMTSVVRAYRDRLLSAQWPPWQELAVLAAYSCTVFILGGLFFRHLKRGFADVL